MELGSTPRSAISQPEAAKEQAGTVSKSIKLTGEARRSMAASAAVLVLATVRAKPKQSQSSKKKAGYMSSSLVY